MIRQHHPVPVLSPVVRCVPYWKALASRTYSRSRGSSNPHNVVKATFNALQELRSAKDIAQLRGISVHKVFNG